MHCPCGSQKSYTSCCQPFISGEQIPTTPEALMRSRYTAYTKANIDYIKASMRGKALMDFQEKEALQWAKRVNWIKLHLIQSSMDQADKAYVHFEASFVDGTRLSTIHEKSKFIQDQGRWYYIEGELLPSTQPKTIISRNTACPCGSHRKFKHCHGSTMAEQP